MVLFQEEKKERRTCSGTLGRGDPVVLWFRALLSSRLARDIFNGQDLLTDSFSIRGAGGE